MHTQLTVPEELMRFLGSIPVGILCGLLLEVFRTLRALLPHHPAAVFLEDALFSFLCCFFLQCYAWSFCGGVLRWMYFPGAALGLAVYLLTFGTVWMRMLLCVRRCCCAIKQKIRRVFVGNPENSQSKENFTESP